MGERDEPWVTPPSSVGTARWTGASHRRTRSFNRRETAMRPRVTHRRPVATGTAVVLALALLVAGCGSVGAVGASRGRDATTPEEQAVPTDLPTSPTPGGLECGARVGSTGGTLTLTARFPASAAVGAQQVDGTVTLGASAGAQGVVTPRRRPSSSVTAASSRCRWPRTPSADSWISPAIVRRSLPASVRLVPCAGEGVLAPGTYDLYARVVVNLEDGSRADSLGGPWPLELR